MGSLKSELAGIICWLLSIPAGVLPERVWPRLEPWLPIRRTAWISGIITLLTGFFLDLGGFLDYGAARAFARNDQIHDAIHAGLGEKAMLLAGAGSALAILTLVEFIFLTPLGLFATYLLVSGALRAVSAGFDDPRGDPILSFAHWSATTLWRKNRQERVQIARERLEGADARDVLQTGEWAGISADFIVLAARRKHEWTKGAIVMTSTDWYRLGEPFDTDTPAGLRTAYPLTKMESVEVVRRGIQYELPRLRPSPRKV